MTNFLWFIENITAKNEVITSAKYRVEASDDDNTVTTEGYWHFGTSFNKKFADITEQDVIDLIKKESIKDDVNVIESRLIEQLEYLADQVIETPAPWLPQIFTPNS